MKYPLIDHLFSSRKTVSAINVCLGVLLGIAVLFFLRDIVSLSLPSKERISTTQKKKAGIERHTLQDYALILKNNPFGFPGGELKPLTGVQGQPVSQTDLTLIGTVSGRRDASYAFLVDKTGQQEVFKPGQQVFGLGKLVRVEKNKVTLNANGREVVIPMAETAVIKEVKPGAASPGFGVRTGESTYMVDQQKIQDAVEKPNQILTDARFVPNMVDGKQQGFSLREVRPGGIYQSLGLQNGDVLLRINEFAISNPETALQAFTALRGIDRAQLDIIRNGSKMTLTYQIR